SIMCQFDGELRGKKLRARGFGVFARMEKDRSQAATGEITSTAIHRIVQEACKKLTPRADAEQAVNRSNMIVDRVVTESQPPGDLFVGEPTKQQLIHPKLRFGKVGERLRCLLRTDGKRLRDRLSEFGWRVHVHVVLVHPVRMKIV